MTKQPPVTVGLRLGPTAKGELTALVGALRGGGDKLRQEDVVGALLRRAHAAANNPNALAKLAADARAHRVRAAAEGF